MTWNRNLYQSPDNRFGGMLKVACRRTNVPEIGTAVCRRMSSAITNTHFDQADRVCIAATQDDTRSTHPLTTGGMWRN
jgi:hypothetical protein